jgi:two-component system phosphate regulon sensor histidine kinase PhoR
VHPFRLLARAVWLALPVSLALVALLATGAVAPLPGMLAWLLGLVASGALAWLRESRLDATRQYLAALADGREPGPLPDFGLLGGDELATALHRLDRALAEERARQAETDRLLGSVLDAVPDPLLLVGGDWNVASANRAARALVAYEPVGKPLEASLRDPGVLAAVEQALGKQSGMQLTLEIAAPAPRAFGVQVVPLAWRGRPAALVGLRELTEQVMIERMRSDFVANVSHELRTPLTALKGFIETLRGPARDDPVAHERFLETMAGEAERMARLVDDLLSLSRIELSAHRPPAEQVDLVACIEEVVETLGVGIERRGVTLDMETQEGLPTVRADHDQMVQLLTNLLDNAIKYGGDGGEIHLKCHRLAAAPPGAGPLTGRPAVRLVVADRGPGIAREHLPRLTERFFRVDTARSRQLGGTGLGLAIVKHILRRHRGHLSIESELGAGTTVGVYLPVD